MPLTRWQRQIEDAVSATNVVAVFVGKQLGRVQDIEVDFALSLCIQRHARVIPVLLPGASMQELRIGLSIYSVVDLTDWPDGKAKISQLELGIRAGKHELK